MSEILFHYQKVNPTTWAYLSSLLMLALFFQFNRFWSVRNLDLILLILLAPGLLLVNGARVEPGETQTAAAVPIATASEPAGEALAMPAVAEPPASELPPGPPSASAASPPTKPISPQLLSRRHALYTGYVWLFAVSLIWLVRMLIDPMMIRRPLLEPNATKGCLVFLGCSLFIFLMANVITSSPSADDLKPVKAAESLLQRHDNNGERDKPEDYQRYGPGFYFLHALPAIPTHPFIRGELGDAGRAQELIAKTMAIAAHLAVVIALVTIGYWHFENIKMGIGAATLYLMLPYTAQMTGHVDHVLPAALMLWAVVLYRRPALAGIFIGLSASVVYYPIFLLPLWMSFYWQRGFGRFMMGVVGSVSVMILSLMFVSSDLASFWMRIRPMFALWVPRVEGLHGIWALGWDPWFRLPVIVACGVLSIGYIWWPAHKNLGTLLSCSSAMMLAVQFWHGFGDGGGMYMAWYLPLLLMTVFRPNLEDRVALTVLGEGWFLRRVRLAQLSRAA